MLLLMVVNSEADVVMKGGLPRAGVAALVLSCVGGLGMSYFSFALRAAISATSFSVIGNICKVLTILVNILMWDQHASEPPPFLLLFCTRSGCRLVFSYLVRSWDFRSARATHPCLRCCVSSCL